ncbi:FtsX-like permease family protein [Glutamicibacter sp.]|uniref:FtsX-like permease family protein n=1 Tax=Glutamicibacter sp. TaxID=1931995 RepID=UPI002B487487|nr:FtsX-like permease family protein [Glutamicibacter sp.]HJX76863.1 FtsX-like permease family protein [Glutamicibacter sp.]
MLQLALRTLRFRAGTFAAAFLAMFFAAAILMACGGLIETGIRTAVVPGQLESADLVVAGNQEYHGSGGDPDEPPILPERVRIDAELQAAIQALPGVEQVRSHVFENSAPAGKIDALSVEVEPGADLGALRERINAELDDSAVTLIGEERGQAEHGQAKASGTTVMALAGVFTAFALLVSIFGVSSMLALSITQRQRDLALLRAIGGTPEQIRSLVFRETLLLSIIATALAVAPGQLLGRAMFNLLSSEGIAAEGLIFHQGWVPTVSAMVIALGSAVAGALSSGRRAASIKPTQALAEASVHNIRGSKGQLFLGAGVLAAGIAMSLVTVLAMSGPLMAATGAPAVLLLSVGFALLSPILAKLSTFAVQWPALAMGGVTGQLAVLNARGSSGRMAAVMAPVILLTGVSAGLLYLQSANDAADRQTFASTVVADAVVGSEDGFDAGELAQINALPGVAAASEYVESTGFIEHPQDASPPHEGWNLVGVSARGAGTLTAATISSGALGDFHGNRIAIEERHAQRLEVSPGDHITLRMGDNSSVELEVAGLFTAPEGYDSLLLPAETLASHTTTGFATQVLVSAPEGSSTEQLMQSLNQWAAGHPGMEISGKDVLLAEYDAQKQTANFALYMMVLMVAGYAAITVINTLASSMIVRRREFGVQRLAGATRKQVLQMVWLEGCIVSISGIAIGTMAAAIIVVPVNMERLGSVIPAGSPWSYLALVVLTTALILGSMLIPAFRVTRGRPAEAALSVE